MDLESLYASGLLLDSAWIDQAAIFNYFDYQALLTDPINDADVLGFDHPRYLEISRGWLPKTAELRQRKLALVAENERINLFGKIYCAELWALGYRTLEDGFDELIRVPRQAFFVDPSTGSNFPDVDWNKSEIRFNGFSYFGIRVVDPPKFDVASSEMTDATTATNPKPGRPNTKERTRECVAQLLQDSGFEAMSRGEQAEEVRAKLLGEDFRHKHECPGFKTSTIARTIGEIINAKRSNK